MLIALLRALLLADPSHHRYVGTHPAPSAPGQLLCSDTVGDSCTEIEIKDVALTWVDKKGKPRPQAGLSFDCWAVSSGTAQNVTPSAAHCFKSAKIKTDDGGLINTTWGQRWGYSQFAPPANLSFPNPRDQGTQCRLGCAATAVAQIMFFHKLCPSGAVNYTVPGFAPTGMNFTQQAHRSTTGGAPLCDWGSFANAPPNKTSDATMKAVAKVILFLLLACLMACLLLSLSSN